MKKNKKKKKLILKIFVKVNTKMSQSYECVCAYCDEDCSEETSNVHIMCYRYKEKDEIVCVDCYTTNSLWETDENSDIEEDPEGYEFNEEREAYKNNKK